MEIRNSLVQLCRIKIRKLILELAECLSGLSQGIQRITGIIADAGNIAVKAPEILALNHVVLPGFRRQELHDRLACRSCLCIDMLGDRADILHDLSRLLEHVAVDALEDIGLHAAVCKAVINEIGRIDIALTQRGKAEEFAILREAVGNLLDARFFIQICLMCRFVFLNELSGNHHAGELLRTVDQQQIGIRADFDSALIGHAEHICRGSGCHTHGIRKRDTEFRRLLDAAPKRGGRTGDCAVHCACNAVLDLNILSAELVDAVAKTGRTHRITDNDHTLNAEDLIEHQNDGRMQMQTVCDCLHIDILRGCRTDRARIAVVNTRHCVKCMREAVCARLDRLDTGVVIRVGMTDADQCAALLDELLAARKLRCDGDHLHAVQRLEFL